MDERSGDIRRSTGCRLSIIQKDMTNKNKIVIIGSSNTDMVIKADRLPVPGETIIGNKFMMNPGGKGANQAVAAARMGGNVTFISKTGNDLFGKQSIELYHTEGICTDYIFSDPDNPSGVALISVDAHGENCILVASGANGTLSPADIEKARSEIESAYLVLMQLEIPMNTVEYAAEIATRKGIKVILNPAPAQTLSSQLLQRLHIITPNKTEAEMLSGVKVTGWESAKTASKVISEKGADTVVLTLGSLGALIQEKDRYYRVEAVPVEAVDTTAAGDTFCGALSVGLSEGMNITDAVKMACKAASISVTKMGAQSSIPYRVDIS
jgi:ribokinase